MSKPDRVNPEVRCAEDACRLRDRMGRIRGQMDREVTGLKKGASNLLDIKYQVSKQPIAGIAIAGALGYLIIPRTKRHDKAHLDDESIERLIKLRGVRIESQHKPPSLMSSGLKLAANALLRAGIAYAGQQLRKASGHAAADS